MVSTDFDRLSRLMLDEFGRVHARLDKHDDRFDMIDDQLHKVDRDLQEVRTDLKSVRGDLDDLSDKVENILGYRKEIDHALERISAIERQIDALKRT
jgi:phage shock protein A